MTVVEVLTQQLPGWEESEQVEPVLPDTLPAPFLEVARHCLRRDLWRRWTVADIVAHMRRTLTAPQVRTAASPQTVFTKWRYVVPAVALGFVLAAVLVGPRLFNPSRGLLLVGKRPRAQPDPGRESVAPVTGHGADGARRQRTSFSRRRSSAYAGPIPGGDIGIHRWPCAGEGCSSGPARRTSEGERHH